MNDRFEKVQEVKRRNHAIFYMCLGFFFVFLIGGIAAAYFTMISPYRRWQDAQNWKKVPCRIGVSEIISNTETGDNHVPRRIFSLKVQYTYQWENATLQGEKVHISGFQNIFTKNRAEWEKLQEKYPLGTSTFCFVNPSNSSEAVLDSTLHTSDFLVGFAMTMIFLLSSLLFLIVGFKLA